MNIMLAGLVFYAYGAAAWLLRGWFVPWLAKGGIWHVPRSEEEALKSIKSVLGLSLISGSGLLVIGMFTLI